MSKDEAKTKDITWSVKVYRSESEELNYLPFYKNYRLQAVALLILLLVILVVFR